MLESRRKRPPQLSSRDKSVLDLERKWGSGPGAQTHKLQEAAEDLGLDAAGYALVLRGLLDDPVAHAYAPKTIEHLRSMRDTRASHAENEALPFRQAAPSWEMWVGMPGA